MTRYSLQTYGKIISKFLIRARIVVSNSYECNPKATNGLVGLLTFSFGDILSQKILSADRTPDYGRAAKTGALGLFMNGLVLHHWYIALDNIFGRSMQSRKVAILKTLADQLLYAPISIVIFFGFASVSMSHQSTLHIHDTHYSTSYLRSINKSVDAFVDKMKSHFISVLLADCCIWPFINIVNFSYIPKNYRPSFIGLVQLFWQVFMSSMGHSQLDLEIGSEIRSEVEISSVEKNAVEVK